MCRHGMVHSATPSYDGDGNRTSAFALLALEQASASIFQVDRRGLFWCEGGGDRLCVCIVRDVRTQAPLPCGLWYIYQRSGQACRAPILHSSTHAK